MVNLKSRVVFENCDHHWMLEKKLKNQKYKCRIISHGPDQALRSIVF